MQAELKDKLTIMMNEADGQRKMLTEVRKEGGGGGGGGEGGQEREAARKRERG